MRRKWGIPFKVAVGYVFLIVLLGVAVWLIFRYTRTAVRLSEVERSVSVRWNAVNRLVSGIFEVDNMERAVCMGYTDVTADYSRAVDRALACADSVAALLGEPGQKARVDTLKMLLAGKRDNTLRLASMLSDNRLARLYEQTVERLRSGRDSVVVSSHDSAAVGEKQVTYVVEKTGRTFFDRLADAFRRSRSDTTAVRVDTVRSEADSVRRRINVGSDVADVLTDIGRREEQRRRHRRSRYRESAEALQADGMELTLRTEQIMTSITAGEQRWIQSEAARDADLRDVTVIKIGGLAVVALIAAVIMLFLVWRDNNRAALYRRGLEHARRHAEQLLSQRERLLLTITHDIKSPVAAISGFVELLRPHVGDGKAGRYLHNIDSSARHLLRLVGALLDYHLLEQGRIEVSEVSFSPSRLMAECTDSFRPRAAEKGLSLGYEYSGGDAVLCRGDAFRIRQIAENLIGNALKYTDSGSVSVSVSLRDETLCIAVSDTGQGMTEEESGRIFRAFTRLPGAQGIDGVGLGLSITRELVSLLGGDITLDTAPGSGSTFTVTLPVAIAGQEIVAPDAGSQPAVHGQRASHIPAGTVQSGDGEGLPPADAGKSCTDGPVTADNLPCGSLRIVVIDDDRLQLRLVGELLSSLNTGSWQVDMYTRPDDLMTRLDGHGADLLLTDIEMPAMSGFDLVASLAGRRVPVVAMTAHDGIAEADFLKAGFAARLSKPVTVDALADVISRVTGVTVGHQSPSVNPFAALTAFADGDPEAERSILREFREQTVRNIEAMRRAMETSDIAAAASLAHKLTPVYTMLSSPVVPRLRALSAARNGDVPLAVCMEHCREIIAEMERILKVKK